MHDDLGTRMKRNYEECYKIVLPKRMPLIIRLDGKAFHTFTRKFSKPFDPFLMKIMDLTAIALCKEIQGAQMAYVQSDEISILVHNYQTLKSGSWFNNELQKIVSVSAGVASATFTHEFAKVFPGEDHQPVFFDSRAFVIPEAEVCNYFIWRQKDWERNSVAMLSQSLFSHKELLGKSKEQQKEMCFLKGKKWEDLPLEIKNGRMIERGIFDKYDGEWGSTPAFIFSKNRIVIEGHLAVKED